MAYTTCVFPIQFAPCIVRILKTTKKNLDSLGYHNPTLVVPFRYLRIYFASLECDSYGLDWNLAHKQTPNCISNLLAVRYSKEPIDPLYLVESTWFLASSASIRQFVAIRVTTSLQSSILNFFIRSKQYFDWLKNVHAWVASLAALGSRLAHPS